MSKKIRVLAVTGIRSEYDILYPVLDFLRKDKSFEIKIVVAGAHLSDWHQNSIKAIEDDGFIIADKIDYLLMTDRVTQRSKGAGILIQGLTQVVERENPNFLLVVGDREESIATAVVGNYMGVLVTHLAGGDTVYGNTDDLIRFAVSKLANIHFVFSQKSAENLKRIGEEAFRIFIIGNPALDIIRFAPIISLSEISRQLDFDITDGKYLVLLQHPLSSERENAGHQMEITLQTLDTFCTAVGYKTIGIYPNVDPGAYEIVNVITRYAESSQIRFFKNLPRTLFVNVMRQTRALVGNSSMGILEAPFYKFPVVNVGNRQRGRENAGNIEFVPHKGTAIKAAIHKACINEEYRRAVLMLKNPFGDGRSSKKIRDVLKLINLSNKKWIIKKDLAGISL